MAHPPSYNLTPLSMPSLSVDPNRWPSPNCSPSHLSDATTVAKPETRGSSLAFPSLTHIQLVTMASKVSFLTPAQICALIFTRPASGHIISHQNGCNGFLAASPACSLAPTSSLPPSTLLPGAWVYFTNLAIAPHCLYKFSPRKPPERKLRT